MNDALDQAALMVAILIGIGLLLFVSIAVAIAYFILLELAYQHYRRQAAEAFDEVVLEHTGGFQADDVAFDLFGVRPQANGSHHVAEILFGMEVNGR